MLCCNVLGYVCYWCFVCSVTSATYRSVWISIRSASLRVQVSDCHLRQVAGGTEFALFGSRPCFLRWFYNRFPMYFGHKSEEHIKKHIKTVVWKYETILLEKLCYETKVCFFWTFPALQGPRPGPYEPIWTLMGPYEPEKSQKIHKKFAFIGAFKGPCMLP